MPVSSKSSQLQIRVSQEEKLAIRKAAQRAGMDMSEYVLSRVLSQPARQFQEGITALTGPAAPAFALAEIHSLLSTLTPTALREAIAAAPEVRLTPFLANYLAALVEAACEKRGILLPAWIHRIPPLEEPYFGSSLQSLRLYLLTHSPAPFRRRNLFVDTTLGDRV